VLVATNLLTAKLHSLYVKEPELEIFKRLELYNVPLTPQHNNTGTNCSICHDQIFNQWTFRTYPML